MPTRRLHNYVRAYRRRTALTQREVAFLLGRNTRASVSEIERQRVPLLRTALMLEIIFGAPVGELFAGMRDSLAPGVEKRFKKLASELSPKTGTKGRDAYRTARKLNWIATHRALSPDVERITGKTDTRA